MPSKQHAFQAHRSMAPILKLPPPLNQPIPLTIIPTILPYPTVTLNITSTTPTQSKDDPLKNLLLKPFAFSASLVTPLHRINRGIAITPSPSTPPSNPPRNPPPPLLRRGHLQLLNRVPWATHMLPVRELKLLRKQTQHVESPGVYTLPPAPSASSLASTLDQAALGRIILAVKRVSSSDPRRLKEQRGTGSTLAEQSAGRWVRREEGMGSFGLRMVFFLFHHLVRRWRTRVQSVSRFGQCFGVIGPSIVLVYIPSIRIGHGNNTSYSCSINFGGQLAGKPNTLYARALESNINYDSKY